MRWEVLNGRGVTRGVGVGVVDVRVLLRVGDGVFVVEFVFGDECGFEVG